jgi:hypothetical protein
MGPDRVVFLAIGLLLTLALGLLILRALTPEARAWAEKRAPWLLAGLAGLLWLLSLFRRRSPVAPEPSPAGEGYLTTRPTPPPTVDEVKAQQGTVYVEAIAEQEAAVEEIKAEVAAAGESPAYAAAYAAEVARRVRRRP